MRVSPCTSSGCGSMTDSPLVPGGGESRNPIGKVDEKPIEFVNPDTGEFFKVKPAKVTVDLAYKLGYLPASAEDMDRADAVDGLPR